MRHEKTGTRGVVNKTSKPHLERLRQVRYHTGVILRQFLGVVRILHREYTDKGVDWTVLFNLVKINVLVRLQTDTMGKVRGKNMTNKRIKLDIHQSTRVQISL